MNIDDQEFLKAAGIEEEADPRDEIKNIIQGDNLKEVVDIDLNNEDNDHPDWGESFSREVIFLLEVPLEKMQAVIDTEVYPILFGKIEALLGKVHDEVSERNQTKDKTWPPETIRDNYIEEAKRIGQEIIDSAKK